MQPENGLRPETLQWYLDFLSGGIQFRSEIEIEQTHDSIVNMLLDDLRKGDFLESASGYTDALRISKRIYVAQIVATRAALPVGNTAFWAMWAGYQDVSGQGFINVMILQTMHRIIIGELPNEVRRIGQSDRLFEYRKAHLRATRFHMSYFRDRGQSDRLKVPITVFK